MKEHDLEMVDLDLGEAKFVVDVQFHDALGISLEEDGTQSDQNIPVMVVRWQTRNQIVNDDDELHVEAFLMPPEHWMSALSAEMLVYATNKFGKEREEVNDE